MSREGVVQNEQAISIFQIPLIEEITIDLLIKSVLIFFIKWQFFSNLVNVTQDNSVKHHMGLFNSNKINLNLENIDG